MTIFLVALGVITVAVAFFKVVTIKEAPQEDAEEAAQSAAVRERVYGEARIKKYGDVSEEHRPKALKLWERASGRVDGLVAAAEAMGIEAKREEIGLELTGPSERLFLNVDVTQIDPVFLLWTEDLGTGESSDLSRIKRLREVMERVGGWIDEQSA